MRIRFIVLIICGLFILLAGCSFQVVTPPTRLMNFNSPGIMDDGEHKFGIELGYNVALFTSFEASHIIGTYSRGLKGQRQISLSLASIDFSRNDHPNPEPYYYALDVDYKLSPQNLRNVLSLNFGGGLGLSNYGRVYSPHIGFSSGYEGKYIIPFINTQYHIAFPSPTRKVTYEGESENFTITTIFKINAGLKIAIGEIFYINGGVGRTYLKSVTDQVDFDGVGFGIEYKF